MSSHSTRQRRRSNQRHRRAPRVERLEGRRLFAFDAHNAFFPCDVNDDGVLAPLDALLALNELQAAGVRDLPATTEPPKLWLDVDANRTLNPADVLLLINQLNSLAANPQATVPLIGSLAPESDPDGNGVVLVPAVTLQGQTAAGASVRLTVGDDLPLIAQADDAGRFQFTFTIPIGSSSVRLEATDQQRPVIAVERLLRHGDVVLDWNATLLGVIRDWTTLSNDPYSNRVVTERPPVAARNLAMVHLAMFEALNAIDQRFEPYVANLASPDGTSPEAAAASAAHRVAVQLYRQPQEVAVFDAALAEALSIVPEGVGKTQGITLGVQAGDAILAARAHDGANATVSYAPNANPGDWNRTFPDFLPPLLPQWPQVEPFVLLSGDQFRPAAPPPLDSVAYAQDVDEVMRLGGFASGERTAEQTEIALFWADGGGTFTPPGHWNQIAADVSIVNHPSLSDNARLFALLNAALADAGIAAWDAKYAYDLWRPIDAIRRGDVDDNPLTAANPTWIPLLKTPPFPTYTSGHSTFSGAAATVLTQWFGDDFAFASQADGHAGFRLRPLAAEQVVTRTFPSFQAAAEEAGQSRIYGGIHFQFDNLAGLESGRAVGQFVVEHLLLPAS